MSKEVIIVGAGPGGLATAILLAASGVRVKVFERADRVGGRTSSFNLDGFTFDAGPTFFLYPRVLEDIFRVAGTSLSRELELIRLDPQYRILFGNGGGHIDATPNVAEMERQITRIHPPDAPGFARFLQENRAKMAAMEPCLEMPYTGWRDLISSRMLKMLPMLRPHQSLDGYLKRFFSDERVRLAFCFQSKYLGMSPFRCPSLFSILSYLEYAHGVYHPVGGCAEISRAMARVAQQCGAEIMLGEPVEEILFRGRRAVGIRTPSGAHHADAVVVNGDFARAMSRLVPDHLRRRWTDKKIAGKKFSCSTFMLYLGVDGEFDLPHHNIFISGNYAGNLDDIEHKHVLSEDPSFYVQNASVTDSTLAPRGQSALYVLVPVTHQHPNVNWNRERARYRDLALTQIEKAGFTGVKERIVAEKILTPDDWDQQYQVHLGATFNLAHSLDQLLHLRPRNRFEDLDGMYLVGGGTHPGSGLPVIFESAKISARLLMKDFGMQLAERGTELESAEEATALMETA